MLQNNPGDRGLELVGNKDWTELTAVGTGPSVVCCVPPHACRSLQTQLRVHKLPAVSADPAAQASAPRMAPPPAPAGGGNENPLQYSWKIPQTRGSWWATVHGVTKS